MASGIMWNVRNIDLHSDTVQDKLLYDQACTTLPIWLLVLQDDTDDCMVVLHYMYRTAQDMLEIIMHILHQVSRLTVKNEHLAQAL